MNTNPPSAPDGARADYDTLLSSARATLEGIDDPIAVMATLACLVYGAVPGTSFAGFYRVVAPGLLRIGPYQGPLGCLEISFDRGVCGAAAKQERTQLVPDVEAFPGHIACDAAARSEVVIPVFDGSGTLVAVLDLDSHLPDNFDDADAAGLERLLREFASAFDRPERTAFG
ncbi:MAG: GAF domain-containing protein [Thermoanaerobaculia bacterium]